MSRRILVHLTRQSADRCFEQMAQFIESVVDVFHGEGGVALVDALLEDNRLSISAAKPECPAIKLKRPAFCPIHNLSADAAAGLPAETKDRGIDVGCALLLESADGQILLTRRASHLRTFPGIWVPPGGHIEENESVGGPSQTMFFIDATLRELKEETGLNLTLDQCLDQVIPILALWESTFPPMLSVGPPVRHHIVAYMHAKLCHPNTADVLGLRLKLDPNEVGAAAWINRDMVEAIVSVSDNVDETNEERQDIVDSASSVSSFPSSMNVTVVDASGQHTVQTVSTTGLLSRVSICGPDIERVSTGTKFALGEWLRATSTLSQRA